MNLKAGRLGNPFQVAAVPRVNLYNISLVDEDGDLHGDACFQHGRLGAGGGGISLEAGVGFGYL